MVEVDRKVRFGHGVDDVRVVAKKLKISRSTMSPSGRGTLCPRLISRSECELIQAFAEVARCRTGACLPAPGGGCSRFTSE